MTKGGEAVRRGDTIGKNKPRGCGVCTYSCLIMSQKKKQRTSVGDLSLTEATVADDHQMENLISVDVLANIFRYLGGPKSVMRQRLVSKKWKEAVKKTIVPPIYFCVDTVVKYNAMRVMAEAMPNLLLINLGDLRTEYPTTHDLGYGKYDDGEDPDERVADRTANRTSYDIEIISNFRQLRIFEISQSRSSLNGRYPVFFSSFPLLQILRINSHFLKWDLEMLSGFPTLKVLECHRNHDLTGNINSLGVLRDTLIKVKIYDCPRVEGNFMDLADFPRLRELDLNCITMTGDIRDIGSNDFSLLESLILPKGVYGGHGYEFQRISDGTNVVRSVFLFKKQRPALKMEDWHCVLSEDSPDWYESAGDDNDTPPFYIRFIQAGSRLGYRWETNLETPCERNWLDPAPDFFRESSVYAKYVEDLQEINSQVNMFKGFYQPPTEEEYNRLVEEHAQRRRAEEEYELSYGYDESDGEE